MIHPEPDVGPYLGPPPTRPPERWPAAQPVWYPPQAWYPPPPAWYPPPVQVRWAPPAGTPPHEVPQPFLLAMRSRDWAWWRPLLGLLLFGAVYLVLDVLAALIGLLGLFVAGVDPGHLPDLAVQDLTDPRVLLFVNATLILAIPCVWLAWAVAHGMSIGWSSSVLARLRRRLFLPLTLRALVSLGVAILLTLVLGLAMGDDVASGPVRSFGWLLLVVVLTTPLQSAAEEYVFRGYLSQAIAGWVRRPVVGAVAAALVTAALFSAAHAPPDASTFLDRFAVGLAASAVVWLTGGLEAAIVLHAVNNVLVFLLAGALGDGGAGSDSSGGVGLVPLVLTVCGLGGYVLLVARGRAALAGETVTAASSWPGVVPAAR
jgi:membrane protease YdiL (CAAX protease family)